MKIAKLKQEKKKQTLWKRFRYFFEDHISPILAYITFSLIGIGILVIIVMLAMDAENIYENTRKKQNERDMEQREKMQEKRDAKERDKMRGTSNYYLENH